MATARAASAAAATVSATAAVDSGLLIVFLHLGDGLGCLSLLQPLFVRWTVRLCVDLFVRLGVQAYVYVVG